MNLPDVCADEFGVPLTDAPSWCADSWCWVNADTCKTGVAESTYFPDSGLFYSYFSCNAEQVDEEVDEAEEPEDEIEDNEGEDADEEDADEEDANEDANADGDEEQGEAEDGEDDEQEESPEIEEDCSCLITHGDGIELFWTDEGVHYIELTADGETYQYPPNHGLTQCQAWDADLEPYCADADGMPLEDAPVWCANQYCYVNPETCTTPKVRPSSYWPDSGLAYSYEACGDVDVFGDEGELCPGVAETEDAWWNDFLTRYICPQVMEELDAAHEAAQAEEEVAEEDDE